MGVRATLVGLTAAEVEEEWQGRDDVQLPLDLLMSDGPMVLHLGKAFGGMGLLLGGQASPPWSRSGRGSRFFARLLDGETLFLGDGTHLNPDEVAELSTLLEELDRDGLPKRLKQLVDSGSWWPPPDREEWALQEAHDVIEFVRERAARGEHLVVVVG